jgi:hypothetical protein
LALDNYFRWGWLFMGMVGVTSGGFMFVKSVSVYFVNKASG